MILGSCLTDEWVCASSPVLSLSAAKGRPQRWATIIVEPFKENCCGLDVLDSVQVYEYEDELTKQTEACDGSKLSLLKAYLRLVSRAQRKRQCWHVDEVMLALRPKVGSDGPTDGEAGDR